MTKRMKANKNKKSTSIGTVVEGGESIIKKFRQRVIEIHSEIKTYTKEDSLHILKRRCSFDLMECALDCCSKGKCPPFTIEEHQMLVDISLEGYIAEKAWYDGEKNIGSDPDERNRMAYERVAKVLHCKNEPSVNDEIFVYDYNLLKHNHHLFQRAIHRKAFWAHMSDRGRCHLENFSIGTSLVKGNMQLHENNGSMSNASLNQLINTISDNYYVCSGLDLFRICFFRNKITPEQ